MSTEGRVVWFNLVTSDVEAAKNFYTKTVGWGIQDWNDCPKPFSLWTVGETPIGGLDDGLPDLNRAGVSPHWIGYVAVDDVDATARRAEELGGEVRTPGVDIPGVGHFAIIADPQGAVIALLSSDGDRTVPDGQKPGFFGWHELHTTDYQSAWKFYSALFDWKHATTLDMGEAGVYFLYRHAEDPDEAWMGGMFDAAKQENKPPHWLYYVNVDDMEAVLARARRGHGKVLHGPAEVPGGGRMAQCVDPQGGRFAIFAPE